MGRKEPKFVDTGIFPRDSAVASDTAVEPECRGSDKGSLQRPGEMERNIHAPEDMPLPDWDLFCHLQPRRPASVTEHQYLLGQAEGLAGPTRNLGKQP